MSDEKFTHPTASPYFGSVRFFKHLICISLALLILIPTTLAICFGIRLHRLEQSLSVELTVSETVQDEPVTPPEEEQSEEPTPAVEVPAYQSLYPDLYAEPADLSSDLSDKTIYLTFDDGPSTSTPQLLEILERYGVKATFFVVGQSKEENLQRMRDIVEAGHSIGVHSYSHNYREIYASVEAYLDDFYRIYTQIKETTGVAPQIFRLPGGSINGYNQLLYHEILSEMLRRGFVYFDWNLSNGDATSSKTLSAQELVSNALAYPANMKRGILLMHDSAEKHTTVEALPTIIERYQALGYQFAALTPEVTPIIFGYSG